MKSKRCVDCFLQEHQELPAIMICPRDQYDWCGSKYMDYPLCCTFLLGMFNRINRNLTWRGINNKKMFQDSLKSLFNASFENLYTRYYCSEGKIYNSLWLLPSIEKL